MHIPLFTQATMDAPAAPPTRDLIDEKYKWKLSDIFSDEAAFETAFGRVEQMIAEFPSLRGTLGQGATALLAALKRRDELWELLDRVAVYAGLRYHEDM
jgi:oligoendopeptidase F